MSLASITNSGVTEPARLIAVCGCRERVGGKTALSEGILWILQDKQLGAAPKFWQPRI